MQEFTIEKFWIRRLSVADGKISRSSKERPGWEYVDRGFDTFLEAPLKLASGYDSNNVLDPEQSNVILVSAPGAVGKSTLARQVAFEAKAVLFDLAKAGCVGDNTISGGLFKMNLAEKSQQGHVPLIIDGLDEARMKVSQDSFKDFIQDVVDLINDSQQNCRPIILFGRTSAVDETWFWLSEFRITALVLEIGYYDKKQATKFAKIQAKSIRQEDNEREPDGRAIELILKNLRDHLLKNKDNFSGYAPVLMAVARQVADPKDNDVKNTARLIVDIERGTQEITLSSITDAILSREQKKLDSLPFKDTTLHGKLYTPEEQVDRLISRIYEIQDVDIETKYFPRNLSEHDKNIYLNALENWLIEHPFLKGTKASSEVFDGLLASKALTIEPFAAKALQSELDRDMKANPFLAEFYISHLQNLQEEHNDKFPSIKSNHVVILYSSLRARLLRDETANLSIDTICKDQSKLLVEISICKQNKEQYFSFITECDGHFQFGSQMENVSINAPKAEVTVGCGRSQEAIFIPPISIEVEKFNLKSDSMAVRPRQGESTEPKTVSLEARKLGSQHTCNRPKLYSNAKIETCGPISQIYPWTEYAKEVSQSYPDPQMNEAFNRLRKLLLLFRSHVHRRGKLSKCEEAINKRRTRGLGGKVLNKLIDEEVLYHEGNAFFLDPKLLSDRLGLHFNLVRSGQRSEATESFLRQVIKQ